MLLVALTLLIVASSQTIKVNGTASIILDRPLTSTHIKGNIETNKPLVLTILRNERQVMAQIPLIDK